MTQKGLPSISSYRLPEASELPLTIAPWRLSARRAALLIHDMQKYFVDAFPGDRPPMAVVMRNIVRLSEHCRSLRIPVVYSVQRGNQPPTDRGLQADFWGPGMRDDPSHTAVAQPIQPGQGDIVIEKHRYSAFQRTDLAHLLRTQGRDQLVITGVFANIGCVLTAAEAFMHDIQPFLAADAVAAYSRQHHDAALAWAAGCCAATESTEAIVRGL